MLIGMNSRALAGLFALPSLAFAKPNIIFIMADDLGYGELSCYGSETIKTPHLDRLAATGVRCTDFHSNGTVCSPTRAALMTGRYQQRSGVSGVITAKSHRDQGLALSEWTLGEAMKEQGYQTALFGKWHLGYPAKFNPVHQGFDEFKGFVSGNVDYHRHIDQEGHFDWWHQDETKEDPGHATDLITRDSLAYIERQKDQPFCLIIHHGAPHYPYQDRATPGFRVVGKSARDQPRQKVDVAKVYPKMVEEMDEGIGQIVAKLEELELRENTLIIFCSDNGPAPQGSSGGLRGHKTQVFEGGHRVPGIFHWPGKLPSGKVCSTPVLTMDLLPTFVTLAGGEIAAEKSLDGVDVMSALQGKALKRKPLFWKFGRASAAREGDWKIVREGKKSPVLLFNLASDLAEKNDLSSQYPEKVQHLTKLLTAWEMDVKPATIVSD